MEIHKISPLLMESFQLSGLELPSGKSVIDLFAAVKSSPADPGQTIRLRLPPQIQAALAYSLQENLPTDLKDNQIQRVLQGASIVHVVTAPSNEEGFLLTLQQTNNSQGQERPIQMFLSLPHLEGLLDVLQQALDRHRAPPDATH